MTETTRCGYRLAGEPEPCSMRIVRDGGRWVHEGWPALDRMHDAVPKIQAAAFTQDEIIALSGYLCVATERFQTVAAGLAGERWMQPLYAEIAAEVRAIRDAVTVMAPRGFVAVAELFA